MINITNVEHKLYTIVSGLITGLVRCSVYALVYKMISVTRCIINSLVRHSFLFRIGRKWQSIANLHHEEGLHIKMENIKIFHFIEIHLTRLKEIERNLSITRSSNAGFLILFLLRFQIDS